MNRKGDRYAGEWPTEGFRKAGITYEPSANPKSTLYGEALPHLNSGKCELLDHSRLAAQIVGLERRTARGGRDSIDHPPGAHDDLANAALGALVLAAGRHAPLQISDQMLARARAPSHHLRSRGFDTGAMFPGGYYDNRPNRRNY